MIKRPQLIWARWKYHEMGGCYLSVSHPATRLHLGGQNSDENQHENSDWMKHRSTQVLVLWRLEWCDPLQTGDVDLMLILILIFKLLVEFIPGSLVPSGIFRIWTRCFWWKEQIFQCPQPPTILQTSNRTEWDYNKAPPDLCPTPNIRAPPHIEDRIHQSGNAVCLRLDNVENCICQKYPIDSLSLVEFLVDFV